MKLILVTPYLHPHQGGVEVYTMNIARQLRSLGWEVVVVTTSSRTTSDVEMFEGMRVYNLKATFTLSNTPIGFGWRKQLKRIFKDEQPDIINAHMPVPYLADIAERASGNIPFVLTYHNDLQKDFLPYKLVAKLLHVTLINRTLRRSAGVIATSEYYVQNSKYLRKHKEKVSIVPPGVDTKLFNPRVKLGSLALRHEDKRVILFVGSINKSQAYKGLETLIKSFGIIHKTYPDTLLLVVGDGDGRSTYEDIADKAGILDSTEFAGFISHEDLPEYYKLATLFAMPSISCAEGFGMVYIEAGAVGIPVIGSRVGGVPFAVKDNETGLLVAPKSIESLSEALCNILDDTALADRLGKSGAVRAASEFDWGHLGEVTDATFRRFANPTIAQVVGYYPPHLGGMERVAESISEELAERGHDVRVITSNIGSASVADKKTPGLSIKRLKAIEFAHTPWAFGLPWELLRLPKHTILHLHLSQAMYPEWVWFVSKLRHQPYIVHFHLDIQPSGMFGKIFLIYKATLYKGAIRHAKKVVVFSKEQQEFIHNTYGLDLQDVCIIPNGVRSMFFKQERTYETERPFSLLYVGRLSAQKRLDRLVGAMKHLKTPANLVIVGDGESRKELEQQVNDLGLDNVTFAGSKTADEILEYHAKADAFVITSDREGMPLVVLEAMAASLPVIGTNVQGTRELLQGVGVLMDDHSPEGIANALDNTLKPEILQKLSHQSSVAITQYSWPLIIDSFENVYRGLRW